jgi:glycosyltransferase involved in cell wall biosynthesis
MDILERSTYESAHKLIGLSPGICKGIASKGISKEKIIEIPNGCDIELFSKEIPIWKPESINSNEVVFIFSGAHGIANGLDSVIDAVKVLESRKVLGYKILFIGNGRLKNRLISRAVNEGLTSRIIFLDSVPKEKLIGLMKCCDVGLQILANVPAFYYGTSPNKFFDYLSAGLPVLTNYPGWVAELVIENNCGFACEPDKPELFANEIMNIIQNKQKLKEMGREALNLANSKFHRADLSRKWVDWVLD